MVTFTTEQTLPFTFRVVDGKGRQVKVDESQGGPTATSSDETVATVAVSKQGEVWAGVVTSVSPSPVDTSQRITVTADADIGEGVQEVVGVLDFTVTLDPRSTARIVEMTAGTPVDKE